MEIAIIYVCLCVVAGAIAGKKGLSGWGYFFASLLITPIIGILCAVVQSPDNKQIEKNILRSGDHKKCPFCAEVVKAEALICKHCGKEFTN